MSDCQKYSLSMTYLRMRDGYTNWVFFSDDEENTIDKAGEIMSVLKNDTASDGQTMYQILWEV